MSGCGPPPCKRKRGKGLFINWQTRPPHANEGNQTTRKGTSPSPPRRMKVARTPDSPSPNTLHRSYQKSIAHSYVKVKGRRQRSEKHAKVQWRSPQNCTKYRIMIPHLPRARSVSLSLSHTHTFFLFCSFSRSLALSLSLSHSVSLWDESSPS